jgi:prepilin peptidase CpaA
MANSMLMFLPGAILGLLLSIAVLHDVRTRRIPNRLVYLGTVMGVGINVLVHGVSAPFTAPLGGLGVLPSLAGAGLGLMALLPMYVLGAMGAGDVKLMAMVGAFLGPETILTAVLMTLLAGGMLAVAVALWTGALMKALDNTRYLMLHAVVRAFAGNGIGIDKSIAPTGKLPYAIAIMSGTALAVLFSHVFKWSLL